MNLKTIKRAAATLVVLGGATLAGAGVVGAAPAHEDMQSGVHICTANHYIHAKVVCTRDDARVPVADLPTARLQYGAVGQTFTASTDTVILYRVSDGSASRIGRATASESPQYGLRAFPLAAVFKATGASGTGTYRVVVYNGTTRLGARTFTVVP